MGYQVGPAEIPGADRVFKVKADVDITKYMAVIQSSGEDNEVDVPGAAGEAIWGIAQEAADYSEGQHHVSVRTMGFSKALAFDGAIVAGDWLQVGDTSGRLDTAAAGDYVVARACEASAAQDDLIVVMLIPGGYAIPGG
jgi:hypothetical protein